MSDGGTLPCADCGGKKQPGIGRVCCEKCWESRVSAWRAGRRETILDRAYLAKEMSKR